MLIGKTLAYLANICKIVVPPENCGFPRVPHTEQFWLRYCRPSYYELQIKERFSAVNQLYVYNIVTSATTVFRILLPELQLKLFEFIVRGFIRYCLNYNFFFILLCPFQLSITFRTFTILRTSNWIDTSKTIVSNDVIVCQITLNLIWYFNKSYLLNQFSVLKNLKLYEFFSKQEVKI